MTRFTFGTLWVSQDTGRDTDDESPSSSTIRASLYPAQTTLRIKRPPRPKLLPLRPKRVVDPKSRATEGSPRTAPLLISGAPERDDRRRVIVCRVRGCRAKLNVVLLRLEERMRCAGVRRRGSVCGEEGSVLRGVRIRERLGEVKVVLVVRVQRLFRIFREDHR